MGILVTLVRGLLRLVRLHGVTLQVVAGALTIYVMTGLIFAWVVSLVLEAREALEILAGLPDRQRADLTLLVAGFSYAEIAQLTGGRTYTNANKHIAKARAQVRLAAQLHRPRAPGHGNEGAKTSRDGSLGVEMPTRPQSPDEELPRCDSC